MQRREGRRRARGGVGGWRGLVGNRQLLAFGAGLAWLLLVHWLVNVWLLCLLSALLAVLGGWLGARVAQIGPGSQVHLERFLRLERCPPSPGVEKQLEEEMETMVQKIIRDFVSSWYRAISHKQSFEGEVHNALVSLALELKRRMALVDKPLLTQKVLLLSGCHLQTYKRAREKVEAAGSPTDRAERAHQLWQAYCELWVPHTAVQSPTSEMNYARHIVDMLLRDLVPEPHLETRTGRFVVVELVTCNVLLPIINKMADPDWLNLLLIGLFSKTAGKGVGGLEKAEELPPEPGLPLHQPAVPNSLPLPFVLEAPPDTGLLSPKGSEPSVCDTLDAVECQLLEGKELICREWNSDLDAGRPNSTSLPCLQPDTLGTFFPCEGLEVDSPLSDIGRDSGPVDLMSAEEFLADSLAALERPNGLDQEDGMGIQARYLESDLESKPWIASLSPCPDIQIEPAVEEEETLTSLTALLEDVEKSFLQRPPYLEKELVSPESRAQSPQDLPGLLSSSPTAPLGTFSFEPLSSPDSPVVIQNLRITGTITAREHSGTGFHPYTLYTVKYETILDQEKTSSLQQVAYHTVNRRYREFLNLQTRLEEKADLRKFIKNIKGPKKIFPDLPFGNMDTEKVEARKNLLESFLKQLCAIAEIANSEEMQEFLALNTDARIAFVKKPFVVSRIDKVVMNAIVDTLKTAFPRSEPQSPTEELSEAETDGRSQPEGKKATKPRLRFASSKIAPVLSVTGVQEIAYSWREAASVPGFVSLAGLESFIQKQEKKLLEVALEASEHEGEGEILGRSENSERNTTELPQQPAEGSSNPAGSETPLADTALDLLFLILGEQWSWLCTENVQKVLHLLFGSLIQRWLEVQVDNLTCTQHWVHYLRLLQESIWPGGVLPVAPNPVRTEEQKTAAEEHALRLLMGILPEFILEFLGAKKCQRSWGQILESLQHPIMNRHVVYCLADIILEFLVPDSSQGKKPKATCVAASGR